jgi:putative Holliday junction resolvase
MLKRTRIVGLDIGAKRTGVAISDEGRHIACPHGWIESSKKLRWAKEISQLAEKVEASSFLVGMPLNQDGEEGEDARRTRQYIAVLRENSTLPVVEWDERFTTVQAERTLISADLSRTKRKQVIDQVAASIILQSYLDSLRFLHTDP